MMPNSAKNEERTSLNRNIFTKVRTLEPPLNADEEEWEDHQYRHQSEWDEYKNQSEEEDESDDSNSNEKYDWELQNDIHIQKAAERQKLKRLEEETKRRLMQGINIQKS